MSTSNLTAAQRDEQERMAARFRRNARRAGATVVGDEDDDAVVLGIPHGEDDADDSDSRPPGVPIYDIDVADVEATLIFRIGPERVAVDIPPIRVAALSKVVWYTNRYAELTQKLMETTQERDAEALLALINRNQRDLIRYVIPAFPDDLLARLDSTAFGRLMGTIEALLQRHITVRTGVRDDPKAGAGPGAGSGVNE
jgi:hypothetical protein